jgi:inhibitor of cysteine peptidase
MNFDIDTPILHDQSECARHNATMGARTVLMVVAAIALIGCSAKQKNVSTPTNTGSAISITEQDSGKSIEMAKGQTLFMRLPSNPTTGYQWTLQGNAAPLELIKSDFASDSQAKNMVGVGGTQSFQFTAKSVGQTVVKLEYRRPWEKDTAAAKTFIVTVVVK